LELSRNLGRTATRPLLLIVALFCALAIGLTAVYVLRSQSAPTHIGVTQPFAFAQDRPGPDSWSRTRPAPAQPSDPWANVGK
jgi:hypothetical protein